MSLLYDGPFVEIVILDIFIFRELSTTFAQLNSEIGNSKAKLKAEIKEMESEMKRLEEIEAKAKVFR